MAGINPVHGLEMFLRPIRRWENRRPIMQAIRLYEAAAYWPFLRVAVASEVMGLMIVAQVADEEWIWMRDVHPAERHQAATDPQLYRFMEGDPHPLFPPPGRGTGPSHGESRPKADD